jgi:hypothetical protein
MCGPAAQRQTFFFAAADFWSFLGTDFLLLLQKKGTVRTQESTVYFAAAEFW